MGTAVGVLWGPASLMNWNVSIDGDYDLDDADDAIAFRFCIPKDGVIDRVGFYIKVFNGAPPDYQVSIETLDASGWPSGANYGGSLPQAFTPVGVGHLWITMANTAAGVAGDLVAAVISPTAVPPDAVNSIDILNNIFGDDSGLSARVQYTTVWTTVKSIPPISIRYTDGSVHGLSVTSFVGEIFDQADTPDETGCKFTVPTDMVCYGARVAFNLCGGNASYEVRLYNAVDDLIASTVIDDEDKANAGTGMMDVFWDEVALTKDAVYRLTLISTHATVTITPARFMFPDADSRNWTPEGARWTGTERTDAGAWTDEALEQGYMALWINDIDFEANGNGAAPWGYVG